MKGNGTVLILQEDPHYLLLPFIWVPTSLTVILSMIIIHYMQSKPLHSKTVMDFVNQIFFFNFCFCIILLALSSTVMTFFQDSGEIIACLIAYVLFYVMQTMCFLIYCIITTQLLLMRDPLNLQSDTFEFNVKAMAGYAAPSYSAMVSLIFYSFV